MYLQCLVCIEAKLFDLIDVQNLSIPMYKVLKIKFDSIYLELKLKNIVENKTLGDSQGFVVLK